MDCNNGSILSQIEMTNYSHLKVEVLLVTLKLTIYYQLHLSHS